MKLISTLQFAFVLLVYKATLLLHVLQQDVTAIMNVPQMKFVTLPLAVALLEKNVKPFVILAIVPEVLIVLPETTGNLVPVDFP